MGRPRDRYDAGRSPFFYVFDEVLTPGRQYVPAEGVPLKIRPDAPAPQQFRSSTQWLTPTDAERPSEDFKARHPVITAGTSTGSVTIATAEYDGTPGPDADRSNNTAEIVVTGRG